MPVCVTGMHRSGTSLIANLLSICGVYLGEESDLMPGTEDNPKGYWEHRKILILNNEILAALGGDWEAPPKTNEGWAEEARMDHLRLKAEIILQEFAGKEPWGWKDPRTSITLPFWTSLNALTVPFWLGRAPKLKVVLCLRNPIEVAKSLSNRKYSPTSAGLDLWLHYNQSILNATLSEDRIITHYQAYFDDPKAELRRLLEFLELKVSNNVISKATSVVSDDLRRHRLRTDGPGKDLLPAEILELYQSMCREAKYFETVGTTN